MNVNLSCCQIFYGSEIPRGLLFHRSEASSKRITLGTRIGVGQEYNARCRSKSVAAARV